ncbi:pheromone receptor STE3 [Phanerochaete sordida]|uniref:Pheromone receptor STE3 n=1 Tax=Phanerochaete sordida TaxID=48140 RepID=A0A9P3GQV3_9APHY|nr:pheromone receptor STE3 [Phanerochaete sordida]
MLHAVPAAALAAAAALALPFAAQRTLVRRQYLPLVAMALWLFCANIVYGVDALLWAGSSAVRVPVWCDISTKLLIGIAYAIPSCLLCIATRLRVAVLPRDLPFEPTAKEQRDVHLQALAFCIGAPVAAMIIHTIVQDHRFDIIEGLGCQPVIPAISAGTIFFWLPALVFTLLALFLCSAMLRHILGPARLRLHAHLALFDRTLTLPRFLALYTTVLVLGALWTAVLLATVAEALRLAAARPALPVDWTRIDAYAWADFGAFSKRNRMFCWWVPPAAALTFAVFGTFFPALAALDELCARAAQRRRSSSLTLRELGAGTRKGSSSHVVVRKDSVVTVSYDDGTTQKYVGAAQAPPLSPAAREPRWSVPWETLRPFGGGDRRSRASVDGGVVIRELPIAVSPLERAGPRAREDV